MGEDDISLKHHVEVVGEIAASTGKSSYQDNSLFAFFEGWKNNTHSVSLVTSTHQLLSEPFPEWSVGEVVPGYS